MDGLTPGRTVHYVGNNVDPHDDVPAIVTHAYNSLFDGDVDLFVMTRDGTKNLYGVPYSESRKTNSWHWIERA